MLGGLTEHNGSPAAANPSSPPAVQEFIHAANRISGRLRDYDTGVITAFFFSPRFWQFGGPRVYSRTHSHTHTNIKKKKIALALQVGQFDKEHSTLTPTQVDIRRRSSSTLRKSRSVKESNVTQQVRRIPSLCPQPGSPLPVSKAVKHRWDVIKVTS